MCLVVVCIEMASGAVAENIDALKRKRLEVRAAKAALCAEAKRLKVHEDAAARQWVLPEDGRLCTLLSQLACHDGHFRSLGRRTSSSCCR